MLIQTVRFIVYIISIPDEEPLSETAVGCSASYFVKSYDVPIGFVTPSYFEAVYCLFTVAEGWLLLDIGWFVLLLYWLFQSHQNAQKYRKHWHN